MIAYLNADSVVLYHVIARGMDERVKAGAVVTSDPYNTGAADQGYRDLLYRADDREFAQSAALMSLSQRAHNAVGSPWRPSCSCGSARGRASSRIPTVNRDYGIAVAEIASPRAQRCPPLDGSGSGTSALRWPTLCTVASSRPDERLRPQTNGMTRPLTRSLVQPPPRR